ncbi:MAG: hypothetical protein AB8I08_04145 [Sandaracinaceae bacterium]
MSSQGPYAHVEVTVRVEHGEGLYTLIASGEYSVDDLFFAFEHLVTELRSTTPPRARPALVLDVRESESLLRRPPDETRRIISRFRRHEGLFARRVAIIVRGHARYGLMRMATTWAALAGYEAQVFFEPHAARSWVVPREGVPSLACD